MKLHLPKLLLVMLLGAISVINSLAATIEIGRADVANSYSDNLYTYKAGNSYISAGTLKIGKDEKVGYFDENDNFVTSFGDGNASGLDKVIVTDSLTVVNKSGYLQSNVEIDSNGQLYLGGKNGKNQFAGLVAKDVTIKSTATGQKDYIDSTTGELVSGNANLWVDALTVDKLIIDGGVAYVRTSYAGGNSTAGNGYSLANLTYVDSAKSATIFSGLYINGGYLMMGRQSNGNQVGAGDRNETDAHFVNVIKGELKQTGGVAEILGKTYLEVGTIEQTGGKMYLAQDPTAGYEYLRLGKDTTTIKQSGNAELLDIEGKIIYGSDGKGSMKLNIEQTNSGTMELRNGVMFTTSNNNASQITQSGGGVINLSGDYTSALFNVTQTAGTLNIGTTDKDGNVLTTGNMAANSVSIGGKLNVVEGASLNANTITVNNSGSLNVDELSVAGTLTNNGTVQATGTVTATGTVDNNKNMEVQNLVINSGTTTNAEGATLTAGSITVNEGATLINYGTISSANGSMMLAEGDDIAAMNDATANLITIAGGKMEQYGVTTDNILVQNGGTLTLAPTVVDGNQVSASVGAVTLETGANMVISGNAQTGALTLEGGTITFVEGATLSSTSATGLDKVEITVNLSDAALEDLKAGKGYAGVLFTVAGDNSAALNGTSINFQSQNAGSYETTVKQDEKGNVTIGALVPEPTTATLSLLALAALAARRRRAA